jgi:hypothetical protein
MPNSALTSVSTPTTAATTYFDGDATRAADMRIVVDARRELCRRTCDLLNS